MTVYGTLVANAPSSLGWWSECTLSSAIAVGGTNAATVASIVYNNLSFRQFQPSLPVSVIIPVLTTATSAATVSYTTLQNSTNNVLAVASGASNAVGIASAILGVTAVATNTSTSLISYTETGTLTITFVNGSAAGTLAAGTRLLIGQAQGN